MAELGRVSTAISRTTTSNGQRAIAVKILFLAKSLLVFYLLALAVMFLPVVSQLELIRGILVFLAITFVPGLLALLIVNPELEKFGVRSILYAAGLSLIGILIVGFLTNLVLPVVGVKRPLSLPYLAAGNAVLVSVLGNAVLLNERLRSRTVTFLVAPSELFSPIPLAFVLLPLLSILAIEYLDQFRDNTPLLILLVIISLVPILVAAGKIPVKWHGLGVTTIALALTYHVTFSGAFWFPGNPDVIVATLLQRWTPGVVANPPTASELLTNTVLYPTYSILMGTSILVELNVVNPLLVTLIPLSLYVTFRSFVTPRTAFLGATLFMFAHPFMRNYPTAGRAAGPVIFLALVGLVLSDSDSPVVSRGVLALLFAPGIIVSHYGTTWFVMVAFVGATLLLSAYPLITNLLEYDRASGLGTKRANGAGVSTSLTGSPRVFSLAFIGFFVTSALGWYMYTVQGGKLGVLLNHLRRLVVTISTADFFGAGTTTSGRVLKQYGSQSIQYSKVIYAIIGVLMIVGFAFTYYRRFYLDGGSRFSDVYLAVATMMFGLFGSTFAFPNQWNGGRPMLISFTFVTVFAAVGAVECVMAVTSRLSLLSTMGVFDWLGLTSRQRTWGLSAFAVLLAVLLILNTGVAAATVLGGTAPVSHSVKFEQQQASVFFGSSELDLETHAWLLDKRRPHFSVYGDKIAIDQTDWYRPMLTLRTEEFFVFPYSMSKPYDIFALGEPGIEPGYVMLLFHNQETNMGAMWENKYQQRSLEPIRPELEQRNLIYTTGKTSIYHAPNQTGSRWYDEWNDSVSTEGTTVVEGSTSDTVANTSTNRVSREIP